MQLTINVTQEHIDAGKRHKCRDCPIALAMTDAGFEDVRASLTLGGKRDGRYVHATMLADVWHFMARFDAGLPVSPFTFTADFT